MCAVLSEDSNRVRHDAGKLCIMNLCLDAKIPADAEIFGLFRDLIPAELTSVGGELQFTTQKVGIIPDLRLRLPTNDGPEDLLGEVKFMSAGVS